MEKELLDSIVTSFVGEMFDRTTSLFSGLGDEVKQFFNRGLKRYLEKQKEKYSHIKTLLRGNTPVYLYDIYFHLKLKQEKRIISTKSAREFFKDAQYITIIGDAGSGKSTLVKHLFLNSIYEKCGIPILIELRYLNDYGNSFEDYIQEKIFDSKLAMNDDILLRLLDAGKFILFLDGFDELNASVRPKVVENLNNFIGRFEKNRFVLTTRPYSNIEHLPLFHNYHVIPLQKDEIEGFVHKQLSTETELAQKIVQSVKANRSVYIQSFLTNPLLLSLYILTFQSDSSVPSQKSVFYRRVINVLFSEHDSKTKLGYPREKLTRLNQQQFEEILKAFCLLSYFEGEFSWTMDYVTAKLKIAKSKARTTEDFDLNAFINDMKLALALWVDDNGTLAFAHRSLQEYFAALAIKELNPEQKARVYEKVIERFSGVRILNEIENFVSLCEEMDGVDFIKDFKLPLLKELHKELAHSNDKELGQAYLAFFISGIANQREGPSALLNINNAVYKAIYFHYRFTQKLHDHLLDCVNQGHLENCQLERIALTSLRGNIQGKTAKLIPVSHGRVPNDLWSVCGNGVEDLAKEFYAYITNEIDECNNAIARSEFIDRSLVDLI